jgi:hypothetical protein
MAFREEDRENFVENEHKHSPLDQRVEGLQGIGFYYIKCLEKHRWQPQEKYGPVSTDI